MLHMILLECALELVPSEISAMKQVQKHAARRGKKPIEILLDQSHHGREMTRLENGLQRGRPDIVFHSLMSLLETPLCKSGNLTIHLHLQDGRIIEVNPEVRLPRNYDRFVGLIEQLLIKGQVPVDGPPLLKITKKTLPDLVTELKRDGAGAQSILTIENGLKTTIDVLQSKLPVDSSVPVIVGVGAFPHGDFSEDMKKLFEVHLELDTEVMMAWHVCAEILWIYSFRIGVIQSRYSPAE
ncbi:MAG: 16S rRNA methyltransferase [Candidatus Thorarchaeota archaeon]